MGYIKLYILNVLVGFDQLVNAILFGSPDECISTRAYEHYPKLAKFINWLFRNDKHCENSFKSEDDNGILE